MKLGEKLQQLRRQSGLSQEQLAAQLTVSRQAVSKWELGETIPDTENVVQLSRLFGVSCDYLLREEVDERGAVLAPLDAPQPAAPGETHLDGPGWVHNAFVLSLGICAAGTLMAVTAKLFYHSVLFVLSGIVIQILGLVLFELSTPRMGTARAAARLKFYMVACWLVLPAPVYGLYWVLRCFVPAVHPLYWATAFLSFYLLLAASITAALFVLCRRLAAKT